MRRRLFAVLWAVVALAALGGLYPFLKSSLGEHQTGGPRSQIYRLMISAQQPLEEPPVFKVKQGDQITFVLSSNRPGEAHVHGYEKKVTLKPGAEVSLTFTATYAGFFAVHLHDPDGSMHALATLEVQPR